MAQDILFFEADDSQPTSQQALRDALESLPGISFGAEACTGYCSFSWKDAATGARCEGDLGDSPLEEDELHPPRVYEGWRSVPLALHVPLTVPHWFCAEAGRLVEALLERLPHLRVMDTEDTGDAEQEGPGVLQRDRLLASWEQLHATQVVGMQHLPIMQRLSSVALWRYRRERAAGQAAHPQLHWPEALVLQHGREALSAVLWQDPKLNWALPPVEVIVIDRGAGNIGVVGREVILQQAVDDLDATGAQLITADAAVQQGFAEAELLPVSDFRALADGDWTD